MSSIKKNFFYQSIYQILVIILPLITAPYIARTLGSENTGIYSYTNSIAYYFVMFAMLGLEQYGNRCIAQARDDKNTLDKTFSELVTVHLFVSIIFFSLYIVYALFLSGDYRIYTLIQGLYVLSAVFDISWFYFGIEKFKITVTRNIIIKILTVILIFALVRNGADLWKYCMIMSGSYLVNAFILWKFLPNYVDWKILSKKECLKHIKPLLLLFVAVVAAHVYRMIDKVMLGWFNEMADLGCYEYADKIIRIPLSLITALGTVMLSRMSNLYANKDTDKASKIMDSSSLFVVFMSFALAFGLAAISPEFLIIFLGKGYSESVILVELLAVTIPLVAWNNFVRTQILIPLGEDKIYTIAVSCGAIVNVIANSFLIYFFSARGAAIATILSYVIVLVIQSVPLVKTTRVQRYAKHAPAFLLIGGCMYIVVRIIGKSMGVSIITVVCEIIGGASVYCLLSLAYFMLVKKEMVIAIFESIRRRIK